MASMASSYRVLFRLVRRPFNYIFRQSSSPTSQISSSSFPQVTQSFCQKLPSCKSAMLAGLLSLLGLQEREPEDPLIHTIKLGILNLQRQDFNKAESMLHIALKMAQEREDRQAETYIFDVLANVAFEKGDYEKAEKLFVDVMKRSIAAGMPRDDNAIVEMSLKLAEIYDHRKDTKKAEQGYRFCIDAQEKKLEKKDYLACLSELSDVEKDTLVLWARSTEAFGRHQLEQGRILEAQKCFEDALTVSKKVNGMGHEVTLSLLNDVGTVASMLHDYDRALKLLKEAIALGRDIKSSNLAVFYCNLGGVLMEEGRSYAEAEDACREALKLANKTNNSEAAARSRDCLEELKKRAPRAVFVR